MEPWFFAKFDVLRLFRVSEHRPEFLFSAYFAVAFPVNSPKSIERYDACRDPD